jgi:hypothetical protein
MRENNGPLGSDSYRSPPGFAFAPVRLVGSGWQGLLPRSIVNLRNAGRKYFHTYYTGFSRNPARGPHVYRRDVRAGNDDRDRGGVCPRLGARDPRDPNERGTDRTSIVSSTRISTFTDKARIAARARCRAFPRRRSSRQRDPKPRLGHGVPGVNPIRRVRQPAMVSFWRQAMFAAGARAPAGLCEPGKHPRGRL